MRKCLIAVALLALVFMAACEVEDTAEDKERKTQKQNYTGLQNRQPAQVMAYSPTRESINEWMKTWEEPGKVSYVYILNDAGQKVGYYVFEGLPVSYCASLTPTENVVDGASAMVTTTAPAMDGAYYSGSQCNQYYGLDAVSGSYIEFTIGGSQNYFLTEEPLPREDVPPIGVATIKKVESQQGQ